jgi:hypothetical protein
MVPAFSNDARKAKTYLEDASMFVCSATGAGAFFSPEDAAMAMAAVERIVPRALRNPSALGKSEPR